jgi:phosphoglycerate-specific signal transduction histidine kinase
MSYVQTGSEFVTERKKEKLRLVAPCGTDLLHCVLGEPIVVEQFLENLLANLCLLRGRRAAKVIEADAEPLIHLLVDCMIPITARGVDFSEDVQHRECSSS